MKILLLEDHFAVRDELVRLIENMGHTAVPVTDANEAIHVLKTTRMDAVITDIFVRRDGVLLPEGGIRLIGAIRLANQIDLQIEKKAPILAISGGIELKGGFSPLRTARDVGADACFSKPLNMDEVAIWIMDAEIAVEG